MWAPKKPKLATVGQDTKMKALKQDFTNNMDVAESLFCLQSVAQL